jgi:hypothetical protein
LAIECEKWSRIVMMNSFLLRFQEQGQFGFKDRRFPVKRSVNSPQCGRQQLLMSSGTETFTEVKQEAADKDPAARSFSILPR